MTLGLSPKAVLAFLFPVVSALLAAAGSWVVTGDFNDAEIRSAVGGLAAGATAMLGAYIGRPGNIQAAIDEPGSDALLSDEAKAGVEAP